MEEEWRVLFKKSKPSLKIQRNREIFKKVQIQPLYGLHTYCSFQYTHRSAHVESYSFIQFRKSSHCVEAPNASSLIVSLDWYHTYWAAHTAFGGDPVKHQELFGFTKLKEKPRNPNAPPLIVSCPTIGGICIAASAQMLLWLVSGTTLENLLYHTGISFSVEKNSTDLLLLYWIVLRRLVRTHPME